MNYYERHIGDYLKDTAHLTLLEHGIYTRLLDVYYTREGSIPERDAARLVGARSQEERDALAVILGEFFELVDGAYVQARCDREIERFQEKREKAAQSAKARWSGPDGPGEGPKPNVPKPRRQSGAKGTAPSAGEPPDMRSQSERNANAMRTQCDGNAPNHQTPVTSKKLLPTDPVSSAHEAGRSVGGDDESPNSFGFQQVLAAFGAIGVSYHCLMRDADAQRIREWIGLGIDAELLQASIEEAGKSKPLAQLSTGYVDPILRRRKFQRDNPGALHLAGGTDAEIKRDAEAAWAEVEEANRVGCAKQQWRNEWTDPRTAAAFNAIGRYGGRLADIGPMNRSGIKKDFITAFCEQGSREKAA